MTRTRDRIITRWHNVATNKHDTDTSPTLNYISVGVE